MLCDSLQIKSPAGAPDLLRRAGTWRETQLPGAAGTATVVNDLVNISIKGPISRGLERHPPQTGRLRIKSVATERQLSVLQK